MYFSANAAQTAGKGGISPALLSPVRGGAGQAAPRAAGVPVLFRRKAARRTAGCFFVAFAEIGAQRRFYLRIKFRYDGL